MSDIVLENSDSWLLLAIIYASTNGPSRLADIIGCGDVINHAIFTIDELNGGLTRLTQKGYIREHEQQTFSATEKILKPYGEFTTKRRRIFTELEFIRKEIGARDYLPKVDIKAVNAIYKYQGIDDATVENAYKDYRNALKKK